MSIWGSNFEDNDDAADWLSDFLDEPSIASLNDAFDEVLAHGEQDYVEVTEGAAALAAAAITASIFDGTATELVVDEEAVADLKAQARKLAKGARRSLVERALSCVDAVGATRRSELRQLISERLDWSAEWTSRVAALHDRLHLLVQTVAG
ncbi:MAG: DUF4259 domain-containing protein [Proteobacteria bacterium]|nr:DUF4259 domain-containing protein [Pseudomonadota bacterium]